MLPTSPTLGGRSATRFLPEPFLFFLADRQEDEPQTTSFYSGRELDSILLEAVKATSLEVDTPPPLTARVLPDIANPASSTYVPIYSDWVPPVEAKSHVTYAAQWFEFDACEADGDKDDGPAPRPTKGPVEALSS
jgi:hypothetical protein